MRAVLQKANNLPESRSSGGGGRQILSMDERSINVLHAAGAGRTETTLIVDDDTSRTAAAGFAGGRRVQARVHSGTPEGCDRLGGSDAIFGQANSAIADEPRNTKA